MTNAFAGVDAALLRQPTSKTDSPSVAARKWYEWWCRVNDACCFEPLMLFNFGHDISGSLSAALWRAQQPRGGRRAIAILGYMMGRRYMPGAAALIVNMPPAMRRGVEFECARFQRRFLRELDAVHRWRAIDRDTVVRLVREFFEHWVRLAAFAESAGAWNVCAWREAINDVQRELMRLDAA